MPTRLTTGWRSNPKTFGWVPQLASKQVPDIMLHTAYVDLGLLLLRVWFGGAMAVVHGLPKLQKLLAGDLSFGDPLGLGPGLSLGLAVFGELVCGVLIALGLFARPAAVPAAFTMLVAAFVTHGSDPFARKELAIAYLVAFLVIAIAGPGRYAIRRTAV